MEKWQTPEPLVESPVRPGIKYPIEMTLLGDSIDFGYLISEDCMALLASRDDRTPHKESVSLVLNLKRRELALYFPIALESKEKTAIRAYRFYVALDDHFSMCDTFDGNNTSLIIHVRHPPWYSRQLKEAMQLSHDPQSHKWANDDTWVRQTDIVDHKEMYAIIDETPVSLRKDMNSINIARWTTFRFNVKSEPAGCGKRPAPLQQILNALKDFNISVTGNAAFKVKTSRQMEASVWNILHNPATIRPSESIYLSFPVRYQLEVCISSGWLNEYLIDPQFLQRLSEMEPRRAKQMLIHVDTHQTCVHNPMDVFEDIRFQRPVKARPLPANCQELLHATVTATGLILHTPSVEITNRVVRKYQQYSDRFLRVRFEDDSYRGQTRLFSATNNKMVLIFERVRRAMRKGIIAAGRHYEFLAWGNSQLREHGAYFFSPTQDVTIQSIRASMGSFDQEHIVAKRAARMGQCFSTTKPVTTVGGRRQWKKDPTSDVINNNYTFTDGVGRISHAAAELIQLELNIPGASPPSAFQFRLGGCKGVLAIDTALKDVNILIRPSQFKFDSESDELEIIRVSEYWQSFLNRQLILVLSDLGVPDQVFWHKQEECIAALDQALTNDDAALRSLRENVDPNLMTTSIANLVEAGFRRASEPFLMSLLKLYRAWTLKYLKEKAKIPIPKGAFVLGIADETGSLQGYEKVKLQKASTREELIKALPQIFIQYTDQRTGVPCVVEGVCFIARNPSLHRGDIRVVNAVNCEKLQHLRDVVVMPTDGDRDLPSMCSGGDLDGDDYIVCWDPDLIPPEWNAEPFHYKAPDPVKKDNITNDDIINFFHDYLQNDYLGRIAHAHLAAADYFDQGIQSPQCLKLVNLHSMAVDYPKTGVPAQMPRDLERDQWPHFMEKKGRREYKSSEILGKLFDAVERVNFVPELTDTFDPRILHHKPPQNILDVVKNMKKEYEESMRRIMAQHEIRSEFEVWSTFVLSHSKAARDFKFHEEIGQHARTLKETYYEIFCEEARGREFGKLAPFAVAAYHITYEEVKRALSRDATGNISTNSSASPVCPDDVVSSSSSISHTSPSAVGSKESETPMISFPWILQDVLCKIAIHTHLDEDLDRMNPEERSRHDASVLELFDKGETIDWWSFVTLHGPDPLLLRRKDEDAEINDNTSGDNQTETGPSGSFQGLRNGYAADNGPPSKPSNHASTAPRGNTNHATNSTGEDMNNDHTVNVSTVTQGGTSTPDGEGQPHLQDPALMTAAQKMAAINVDDEDEDFSY